MQDSLNYIVCGDEEYAKYHLQKLYKILYQKRLENIEFCIKRITVIISDKFKYNWKIIREVFCHLCEVTFIENNNSNMFKRISSVFNTYNEDYYLITDFSYSLREDNLNFDNDIISLYKSKFISNIGYMPTYIENDIVKIYFGLISNDTLNILDIENLIKENTLESWTNIFKEAQIPLTDSSCTYNSIFRVLSKGNISHNFGPSRNKDLFYPLEEPLIKENKTIGFILNIFTVRGAEQANFDYALYNNFLYDNNAVIFLKNNYKTDKNYKTGKNMNSPIVEQKFRNLFPVYEFGNKEELIKLLTKEKCDIIYYLKDGKKDYIHSLPVPYVVHCVFSCKQEHIHGDKYLTISKDIDKIGNTTILPHICKPLQNNIGNLRKQLNIKETDIVFGRHGGFETFDIYYLYRAIANIVNIRKDIHFVFMNTHPFFSHKQIHYLGATSSNTIKSKFIQTCDAMIYGRSQGESFGLAISDFTTLNKPIILPTNPHENFNHIHVLGDSGIYFNNEDEVYNIFMNFDKNNLKIPVNYASIFSPFKVMENFNKEVNSAQKYNILKLKLLGNWNTSNVIHKEFKNSVHGHYVKLVDENPDFWIIMNKPFDDTYYDPKRTIVFGMEPETFYGSFWNNWYKSKHDFLYFMDENYMTLSRWWINKTSEQLLTESFDKTKENVVSSVVSGQYTYTGHKLRIDFLKKAEEKIDFHIYGKCKDVGFKSYKKELYPEKDEGLLTYKYTFIAENTSRPNYVTEKFVDAIVSECLVFYWGCSNITEYFNDKCFIWLNLENIDESIETIQKAIENNEWEKRLPYIKKAKENYILNYSIIPRTVGLIKAASIKKYTVNLNHRKDRYEKHIQNTKETQVYNIERFEAINGRNIDLNTDKFVHKYFVLENFTKCSSYKKAQGEIGCCLSHFKIWNKVIDINKITLVQEDDITYKHRYIEFLGCVLNNLNKIEWDICFTGWHQNEENYKKFNLTNQKIIELFGMNKLIKLDYKNVLKYSGNFIGGFYGGGTFNYLINPSGANKLVKIIEKNKFTSACDYELLNLWEKLNIYLAPPTDLVFSPKYGIHTNISDIQN